MGILVRATLLAGVLALLSTNTAAAAMWLRIEVVGPVKAGSRVLVTVTTLVMHSQLCVTDPAASPVPNGTWYSADPSPSEPSFSLIAYPAGHPERPTVIHLTHRAVDSAYWDGTVTFASAGPWTLRMAQPKWGGPESDEERCSGARIDVSASDPHPTPATDPNPVLVGAGLLALAIALAARRLRQL